MADLPSRARVEVTPASRLAILIEEVDAAGDWPGAAADHVLMKLRS